MSPGAPATPSRAELRKLVLNYLYHYSFVDTAKAFSKDVPLQGWYEDEQDGNGPENVRLSEEQLRTLQLKREIREAILSGHIPTARELITTHFPSVLSDDPPPPSQPTIIPPPPATIPTTPVIPSFPSSLAPQNISLTLSIQQWIESLRTVPLPYPPPPTSGRSPQSSVSSAPVPPTAAETQDQTELVRMGQQLYAKARQLPPPCNEHFREEIVSIASLIAYKEPEKAAESVRHHLEWSRRKGVATQVNSAILHSLGYPPYVPLGSLVRQLTFVYQMLHELGVRPSDGAYPEGVDVLDASDEDQEWGIGTIPEFRLSAYLSHGKKGRGDVDEMWLDEDEDMDADGEEVQPPAEEGEAGGEETMETEI